ncbi:MAG: AAA family ATPase [Lachnospiraceae bacterium]|nr:AAA family ATPase [Lachnospiraceae bacterium]MDY2697993.1 AAA family ATPase [Lachnospiraceae bacterium]MDY5520677.1 AAA family ATPase [Agathobacter sp.]
MRYYCFVLNANADEIKDNARINIREYAYENPIAAMNYYMSKSMRNNLCFLAYREEENSIFAAFSYDEKNGRFQDAYNYIAEMLNDVFLIKKIKVNPYEITMYQFLDCFLEAKRRDYTNTYNRIIEASNLWIYNYYNNEKESFRFDFKERIISEKERKKNPIYDQEFVKELSNIEAHVNVSEHSGNMVHYIISSHSVEAASDMTETLMQSLIKANRISSKRMEIISEIEPDIYKKSSHLEEIIENNYGGVIVFDLSEKFGFDPVDYAMTSKYLENLLKKYRNHCLFVFTYNMENPGFSYFILPQIQKYVIPVMLREGVGDRKAAVNYMKELIKGSEYAKYAGQAGEFMKQFPGTDFSQTDVLMAYEQFDAWCLNKNVLQGYNYDVSEEFMLDRDENVESSYDKLNKMIGLEIVKEQIDSIIAADIVEKERKKRKGKGYQSNAMHMVFGGNPGSAKTTVAKLFAGIAKEKGILKSGAFVERSGMDLDGLGCVTAIRDAFMAAKGGVLFIDEAYSLKSDTAVTALIQEMENQRDNVIVILAGYNERMQAFMKINEGLKSRIPHWIDFPDYTADELTDIFRQMLQERGFSATEDAIKEAHYIFEKVRHTDNFGNGRYVRNLMERAMQEQAVRLLSVRGNVGDIRKRELFLITKEDITMLEEGLKKERVVGTAQKELDEMIGLSSVKAVLHKAIANYKLNKLCLEKGIQRGRASLHMVFTGNPGTAKTTVARLFAEILKDEKVLSTGTFVEVGRADLVGDHVGATAPMVKRKFKEAQGGVLFIDEAYSLCDSYENGFGDEAINTLVQEMENHRDDVIVIFAGYPEPMKQFLDRNPGMLSRIAFHVEFEDYSTDELCDITKLMLSRKQMTITDAAMDKLRENYENIRESDDYGNGRYVRKILEEAEMNLAERILKLDESEITTELISTIDEGDIPKSCVKKLPAKRKIGFAC